MNFLVKVHLYSEQIPLYIPGTMVTIKPPRLKKGDTIGIVAPASAPSTAAKIEKGVAYLEKMGYRVKPGKHVHEISGYLAGSDSHRADDLNAMFADPEVNAIIAVRGGYGSPRILDRIDYDCIRKHPKIFIGYSDCTALHSAFLRHAGLISFSGPMVAVEMFEGIDPYTEENFWRTITDPSERRVLQNPSDQQVQTIHPGVCEGILVGGNLTVFLSLWGSPYSLPLRDTILLLEEIDEKPYRIDRMFSQLKHACAFQRISGLILGSFTDCVSNEPDKPSLTLEQVFSDYLSPLSLPIIGNVAHGHASPKLTLPIGLKVRLDAHHGYIELLESPVV
jgi:muramoyltetrapeptide carboxypeptidase